MVADVAPHEVYILAGSTSVASSCQDPTGAADVMGVGAVRVLDAAWRPGLHRPADPRALVGDARRLRALGWAPSLVLPALVRPLVEANLAALRA